ncbi:hypothetical protein B0H14DRAFT_3883841 [Mycena olivaceomarginata]|nr:hypothetical protein B0H14DRAFT_3883841 [Mycena olivaceomarginata]
MHRGLLIPEVVELICGVAEFSTLAALARTSHSFQPPALAVLWETQTSLFQLLKCLPSDLVEVVPPPQGQDIATTLRFQRAIMPADLARMLFYAALVKNFTETGRSSVPKDTYAALSIVLPASQLPLFPSLRHLTWRVVSDDIFPYFRILAGRQLRSIYLMLWGSQFLRSALLPYLTTFHPKLTRIELEPAIVDTPIVTQAVYSALRSLNHLEKLTIDFLDSPTLLHLAGLPNLNALHIRTLGADRTEITGSGPIFTALREFVTYSESIKPLTRFLDAIDSDIVNKVDLTVESTAQRFSFDHEIPDVLERMLPAESFRPLLTCTNLTEMAHAWPRLRTLDLCPGCQSARYEPRATLAGLVPLAQHCPDLESFALVLDARLVDPHAKEKPGAGISNLSPVTLDVVESPIDSSTAVASFLSAIFLQLFGGGEHGGVGVGPSDLVCPGAGALCPGHYGS